MSEAAVEFASFSRRLLAALLDSVVWVIGISWILGSFPSGFFEDHKIAGGVIILVLLSAWFNYFAICEWRYGQTIGKNAFGIRVLPVAAGAKLTYNDAALRNLLRLVDLPLALIGVDWLIVHRSPRNQRLGDRTAKTVVVREQPKQAPQPARPRRPGADLRRAVRRGVRGPRWGKPAARLAAPNSAEAPPPGRPSAAPASPSAGAACAFPLLQLGAEGGDRRHAGGDPRGDRPRRPGDHHRPPGQRRGPQHRRQRLRPVRDGARLRRRARVRRPHGAATRWARRCGASACAASAPSAIKWMFAAAGAYIALAAVYAIFVTQPKQEDIASSFGPVWVQVLLIVVCAATSEELCFRGMVFSGIRERLPGLAAALASGVIFGALHVFTGITAVPPLIIFGTVLAMLYERTGSILPGVILHALNNTVALFGQ